MCDQLYQSPLRLEEHTEDTGSFLGALGFTALVQLLALRTAPLESLLEWLTKPIGPQLVEAVLTDSSYTALVLLLTPGALYDSDSPRVGLGLLYKAPHIKTVSFAKAFFNLKTTSEAEVDKRITDPHLIFIQIDEASTVIPFPYVQPLFLDVATPKDITSSTKPRSPCKFKGFKLHKVIYIEEEGQMTQVAYPCLGGDSKSHFLHYQEQKIKPELHNQPMESVELAASDREHWSIREDPVYPACLKAFKERFEASPALKASISSKKKSPSRGAYPAPATASTSTSNTASQPNPDLCDKEVLETVHDILDKVFALRVETLQEMGFVREVDRALTKAVMSKFIRLQLIMGEDLSQNLKAMHADLEVSTNDLLRDLDIAFQNTTSLPLENSAVKAALKQFQELTKLKLALPSDQVDAACEDMDRFLQFHLDELHSQSEIQNLVGGIAQRIADHQSRVHQLVYSAPLKNTEVTQWGTHGDVSRPTHGKQLLSWHLGRAVREAWHCCTWCAKPSNLCP